MTGYFLCNDSYVELKQSSIQMLGFTCFSLGMATPTVLRKWVKVVWRLLSFILSHTSHLLVCPFSLFRCISECLLACKHFFLYSPCKHCFGLWKLCTKVLVKDFVFLCSSFDDITVHGLGVAIHRAINLALQLQESSPYQLQLSATTSTVHLVDEMEPLHDVSWSGRSQVSSG